MNKVLAATLLMASVGSVMAAECLFVPDGYTGALVPVDPTEPPSGPVEPPVGTGCIDSYEIQCGYNVTAAQWASTRVLRTEMEVPRRKTLVSQFITSGDTEAGGSIQFSELGGLPTKATDVWISREPNGPAMESRCERFNSSFVYSLRWTQWDFKYCDLDTNTTYYINMRQVDPSASKYFIERFL